MNKAPAYLWYPKDILTSIRVASLQPLEELWYRRALDLCWLHEWLPAEPEKLAQVIGRGCTVEGATAVKELFIAHKKDSQKIIHDRQEFERKKQQQNRKVKSKAGKASAEKRRQMKELDAQQSGNTRSTDVKNLSQQNTNLSIPIPIPIASSSSSSDKEERAADPKPKLPAVRRTWDEYVTGIRSNTAYTHVDIDRELAKARQWCDDNHRQLTQRFFTNWLNRIDPPLTTNGNGKSSAAIVGKWDGREDYVEPPACAHCGDQFCLGGKACAARAEKRTEAATV